MVLGIVTLFVISYVFEEIFDLVWLLVYVVFGFTFLELLFLIITKTKIEVSRVLPERLSNGDTNDIHLALRNPFQIALHCEIIDELPHQFQSRDFLHKLVLKPKSEHTLRYQVRPTTRGLYEFGIVQVFASSILGLVRRRYQCAKVQTVKCYPAFFSLRHIDLKAVANEHVGMGSRKIRRIGSTLEFEQIKEYILGDDIRTINWKSTAKRGQLMVNQFQDEKSQDIYVAIDKGRTMEMPFNGLSLLDYAINSSLMILSLSLVKYDRAGMFSFAKKMDNMVLADKRPNQMLQIMEGLFAIKTKFEESNFSALYAQIKRAISHRALIVLYTNFESMDGLQRNLPFLLGINKKHVLLVVFFKNKEIAAMAEGDPNNKEELAEKIIAAKIEYDKRLMVRELSKHGILTLLSAPEDLDVSVMNKYLEIKGRGLI